MLSIYFGTYKGDNYIVKCLGPVTEGGIQNVKKLEKIMPKNYEIKHGEAVVGNDKIKTEAIIDENTILLFQNLLELRIL